MLIFGKNNLIHRLILVKLKLTKGKRISAGTITSESKSMKPPLKPKLDVKLTPLQHLSRPTTPAAEPSQPQDSKKPPLQLAPLKPSLAAQFLKHIIENLGSSFNYQRDVGLPNCTQSFAWLNPYFPEAHENSDYLGLICCHLIEKNFFDAHVYHFYEIAPKVNALEKYRIEMQDPGKFVRHIEELERKYGVAFNEPRLLAAQTALSVGPAIRTTRLSQYHDILINSTNRAGTDIQTVTTAAPASYTV
jgi:hypothetical protein